LTSERIRAIEEAAPYRRQRKNYVRARGKKLEQFSAQAEAMNKENRASANRRSSHPLVRGLQSLQDSMQDAIASGKVPEPFPESRKRAAELREAKAKSDRVAKFRQHIFREERVNRASAARARMGGALGIIGAVPSIIHLARGGSLGSLAGRSPLSDNDPVITYRDKRTGKTFKMGGGWY